MREIIAESANVVHVRQGWNTVRLAARIAHVAHTHLIDQMRGEDMQVINLGKHRSIRICVGVNWPAISGFTVGRIAEKAEKYLVVAFTHVVIQAHMTLKSIG